MRKPPAWFLSKLRAIDPRLTVVWKPSLQRWMVGERLRWAVSVGIHEQGQIYRIKDHVTRIFLAEDLGTRVLEWARRLRISRFNSVEHMVKDLKIDEEYTKEDERLDPIHAV